jgi:hypothetical protein
VVFLLSKLLNVQGSNGGDHIGRIFAYRAVVYIGQFFYYRCSANVLGYFFQSTNYVLIFKKMGLATFWATFSQTYLVNLLTDPTKA